MDSVAFLWERVCGPSHKCLGVPPAPLWEHLEALNGKFRSEKKAVVKLRAAPEDLEDEDILEMVNAGLAPITVTNAYMPKIWQSFYKEVKATDVVVDDSGQIGWMMRKNCPKLMAVVNEFVKTHNKEQNSETRLFHGMCKTQRC